MNRRQLTTEIRRGARLVALARDNLPALLAALLAAGERDLAESIASTLGDALWRHDLTGPAARPVPEVVELAAQLRADLAAMRITFPDDPARYAAALKRPA